MFTAGSQNEPIAIVGTSCRFPGSTSSPSKLWDLLHHPYDLTQKVPPSRFNINAFHHSDGEHHGATDASKSYFLNEDPSTFDAQFFSINPREAEALDPQQRLLLETVYEALESAGLSIEEMQGTPTAVYVGLMCADYYDILMRDTEDMPKYLATGTARSIMSNRISYFFDWKGPSMTIDTACSSSLVAVHQAVATLRSGTSRTAIAAGANLIFGPEMYISESKLHMLSPTGRSQMWDAKADGYARGEGTAALVLKTLSHALEDGDIIECIIRETGVNSDGRTKGITMPSATSQADLIRQTYQRAGLDCTKPSDRCQYFEAHGTGTPAGDPIEAEAISSSFFQGTSSQSGTEPLFVGSVKTVIGHLEGAAGLAGLIKASLAIREKTIPPNLHFKTLNPAIESFYKNLEIPVTATPWPSLPEGCARRASVNSFGFGGTNAHAIIESYEQAKRDIVESTIAPSLPFTFSAVSEDSLIQNIEKYSDYLADHEKVNLVDFAYTLFRRSLFPTKATFIASTIESLQEQLENCLIAKEENPSTAVGVRTSVVNDRSSRKLLGIFTGQGAQWAAMGKELIINSPKFKTTIECLESALRQVPDPPKWSLSEEIVAPTSISRIEEAEFSQPLCTAIQIALVDLLMAAGVKFQCVVGHSSGEIAAAYAAGRFSAGDAIRIAYYRGLHAHLARGTNGESGAMMAVGLSFEEAEDFCNLDEYRNKISIAAGNGPKTVTLSGNKETIEEAKTVLDAKEVFARILKIDTAYHSHHMLPGAKPYLTSLRACNITPRSSSPHCTWISSVHVKDMSDASDELADSYWLENLVSTVRFFQAVTMAAKERGPFDAALEVGPHPALKGPVTQTVKYAVDAVIPYAGCLSRGENDRAAFASAVGFLWKHIDRKAMGFTSYLQAISGEEVKQAPILLTGLPTYSWDHSRSFWAESRISRNYRNRVEPPHELLGVRCADDTEQEFRWRNFMKFNELSWVSGHRFQGQTLVPAALYCSMALESSKVLSNGNAIQLVELQDVDIEKAINLEENNAPVEVMFSLKPTGYPCTKKGNDELVFADFWCTAAASGKPMATIFSGRIVMTLGAPSADALSTRSTIRPVLGPLNVDRFYDSLANVGLEFTGIFRGIEKGERRMHISSLEGKRLRSETGILVHPAFLDMALHATLAAFASPGDERFWTPYLPRRIAKMRFNIAQCQAAFKKETLAGMDGYITKTTPTTATEAATYVGDVDVFDPSTGEIEIQIESLQMQSFTAAKESEDRQLYLQNSWDTDISGGIVSDDEVAEDNPNELHLIELSERLTFSYLRRLRNEIKPCDVPENHRPLFSWVDHVMRLVLAGSHPSMSEEWNNDSHDDLLALAAQAPNCIDLDLMRAVGDNLPDVVRGKTTMLEHMLEGGMLDRLYKDGIGMATSNKYVSRAMEKIGHRYPRMRVLEIGAGTGGATRGILASLGNNFAHYTFTDISTGFFLNAKEAFKEYADRMTFSLLNCEKDPMEQGYEENSFDVIVASNVLHATEFLERTMTNVRRLLKPGGYLCLLECTGYLERTGFLMAGLPGWWLGGADGRPYRPTISPPEWDSVLKKTGFSGIDSIVNDFKDKSKYTVSVILTQALDGDSQCLRRPLEYSPSTPQADLLVIGGSSEETKSLILNLGERIPSWKHRQVKVVDTWEDTKALTLPYGIAVLSLVDLDEPVFKSMTSQRLQGIQNVMNSAATILWVTKGCRANEPYANMAVGLGRSIISEMPHLQLQFLDVDTIDNMDNIIGEVLIRLELAPLLESRKESLLWTTEPELVLENGQLYIPRVTPLTHLNDRLNSARRVITKEIPLATNRVAIIPRPQDQGYKHDLELNEMPETRNSPEVEVQVRYSSLSAVNFGDGFFYICLGLCKETGSQLLALSTSNESHISVPADRTIAYDLPLENAAEHIESILAHLVAKQIIKYTPSGLLLLHEPSVSLARVAQLTARECGKSILCSAGKIKSPSSDCSWAMIHPKLSKRAINEILPAAVKSFVDFSGDGAYIRDALTDSCVVLSVNSFIAVKPPATDGIVSISSTAVAALKEASTYATSLKETACDQHLVVDVKDLGRNTGMSFPSFAVVDWTKHSKIAIDLKPVKTPNVSFDGNKTYLLAGLTGDLGQSICRWMVQCGARFLIVGSRTVKPDAPWQKELERMGAKVLIYTVDFTDQASVLQLRDYASKTMPRIAGIMNGCMVLDDKPFLDMPFETLERVVRPKVISSNNLDAVFTSDLDFFVFFSSLAAVNGIPGQANYAAANMYMTALAAKRRKRGDAASVIHIGMILGVGYVERSGRFTESALRSYNYLPIPEHEILQVLGEAVQPNTKYPEIITGMVAPASSEERDKPRWYANPRFSAVMYDRVQTQKDSGAELDVPTKEQLSTAANADEATTILTKCFSRQLQLILQADSIDESASLTDLGIDSLIAVEIRSWFLKEAGVNLPVLKILSGASAKELCEIAGVECKICG